MRFLPQLLARSAVFAAVFWLSQLAAAAQPAEVVAHVFWQEGCPFCERARAALAEMRVEDPGLIVDEIELGASEANNQRFRDAIAAFGIDRPAVPLVVVGDGNALGFGRTTRARYAEMIAACRAGPCPDVLGGAAAVETAPEAAEPGTVSLPWIGEIGLGALSLPVLTVVLAAVDGFNPCAMWVLALLIAFLLGVEDSRRMWTLGLVFLAATGVMYFAVMAAWLNIVLWIGAVGWLRLAIGALAIGAGVYYLREYWTNPEGVCRVTPSHRRKTISEAFQALVEQPNLLTAALGIAALAIVVNLIELVCSAGVPAVFTQMLAMHDLGLGAYYGYLLLYIAVFLVDDTAIFVIAMLTLRATFASAAISRVSHLVGGVVLLALGAVMVLRPDLLG
ncbi:MAG: glutaredoxin domain-containing protein [Rhodobacter sp.]|nr:glutaredoxin domain-containing protein [Rhodobacter sp.]